MVELRFPDESKLEEYLKSQMDLYSKYKTEIPEACESVVKATAAFLSLWHSNLMEKESNKGTDNSKTIREILGLPAELPVVKFNEPSNESPCKNCPNFGKSFFCHCTLGSPQITC